MLFVLNGILMVLLSLAPSQVVEKPDPYGLHKMAEDSSLRQLLLDGRFAEFDASVESLVAKRLAAYLNVPSDSVRRLLGEEGRVERRSLLDSIQSAVAVAALAAQLQMLGPSKAISEAIRWVESGMIRQSGLKADRFPSFYRIIARPNRKRIDSTDQQELASDRRNAEAAMDGAFGNLSGALREGGL